MWSYCSGCCLKQSRRSCSSSLVKNGLSRQLERTTTAPVGRSPPRKSTSMGSVFLRGFQLNHNSDPGERNVGRKRFRECPVAVCASSHHARLNPSNDLMESAE